MAGKLFILMGIPGAGKSSFVSTHIKSGFTQAWISRDMIRFDIVKKNEPYFSKEDKVFKKFIEQIDFHLVNGYDVFADATHLNKKSRAKLLRNLTVRPREISVIWLQTPLDECINAMKNARELEHTSRQLKFAAWRKAYKLLLLMKA